jgi:O-antigen/teichoic acid export membrane protein
LSKESVVKGAAYIYIETIISMFAGYGFWIIISKFTSPQTLGTASAVVSFATIFATIGTLGANIGVQRFLGMNFSENKLGDARVFIKASVALTLVGVVACSATILLGYHWIFQTIRIDPNMTFLTIILIWSTAIMTLLRYIIISSLKTRILPLVMLTASILKVLIAVILVLIGLSALGVIIGFTIFPIIASIVFSMSIISLFSRHSDRKSEIKSTTALKSVLNASVATWIPYSIYTLGLHLGPLSVFGVHGADQAGIYSMAFFITIAISSTTSALFSIAYPAMSAMIDGRKRFAWRATKMTLIVSIPLTTTLIFYSKQIMQLFGSSYINASYSLEILLATMLPVAVTSGITTLVYSYGNYKQVLVIGLVTNLPRVALYFVLVPIYFNTGAALSYSIGSLAGFVASILVAKRVNMPLFWKDMVLISTIPAIVIFPLSYLKLNYILALGVTLGLSYAIYFKLHIMNQEDVRDSLLILPLGISKPLNILWAKTRRKLR